MMKKKITIEAKGYGIVQRDFMKMDISIYAKAVYTLIRTYSGSKSSCYPALNTIKDDLKISKNSVIKAIKELEKINMIIVVRSRSSTSNKNIVNTYIPLSVMEEIDLEKMPINEENNNDLSGSPHELGGSPHEPGGSPHEPLLVHQVNPNINTVKNNIKEKQKKGLNIIRESNDSPSLNLNRQEEKSDRNPDLFGNTEEPKSRTETKVTSLKKEKEKSNPAIQKIKQFWFDEFRISDRSNSAGEWARKMKHIKNIVSRIESFVEVESGSLPDTEYTVDFFKQMCMHLSMSKSTFFNTMGLENIDSKFSQVIENAKNGKNNNTTSPRAGVTNFKFDVADPRDDANRERTINEILQHY